MKAIVMSDALHAYVEAHAVEITPVLERLARETAALPLAVMQVAPEQGALMYLLAKAIGARKILEIGCFTGYSALCMAAALPPTGQLITLDVDEETTKLARRAWADAGLAERIALRLAPALESLPQIAAEHGVGAFDMVFIDADKANMPRYFEWAVDLVRPGGLILVDNVLWFGSVVDPTSTKANVEVIRALNERVKTDARVEAVMLGIADGLTICRKR